MKLHLESARASASRKLLTAFLAVQMVAINFSPAWAAPLNTKEIPVPVGGSYGEGFTPGDGSLTITKVGTTLDWQTFNIGSEAKVNFVGGGTTINKIHDSLPSEIFGVLTADGKIYLLNANGVIFGSTAKVNVGGLVASTFMDVQDNAGVLEFTGNPGTGDITVEGGATINAGAFAYLVGKNVNLAGAVNAGEVLVAAFGDRQSDYDAGSIVLKLGSDNPNSDGGDIDITGSFTNATSISELTGDSVAITNITLYAAKDISQIGDDSAWRADAPITLTAIGTVGIVLDNTGNAFTGPVSAMAENGDITLKTGADITLGAILAGKDITATVATNLSVTEDLTSTAGNINLTATAGNLSLADDKAVRAGEGNIELRNGGTMTINGVIDGKTVTIAATNGALNFGDSSIVSGTTGVDISAHSGSIKLAAVRAENGPLAVTAENGGIFQGDSKLLEIGGASTLTAKNGDIVLENTGNDFGGAVTAIAENGAIALRDANDLVLGSEVTGASNVTITAAGNLTASNVTSHFGDVNLTANDGIFTGAGELYATSNLTVRAGGDLTANEIVARGMELESTAGTVKVTGETIATGASTLTAGYGDIVLTNAANEFRGAVTATATRGSVELTDKSDLNLGEVTAGNGITATAGGHLTATNMTATGGDVTLTAATNLTLNGLVSVADGSLMAIATGGKFTTAHDLEAGKSVTVESGNGNLVLGNVTAQDGDVSATASGNLELNGVVSVEKGSLTAIATGGTFTTAHDLKAGKDITIESGSGDIALPMVTAGDKLTVRAADGAIAQSGAVTATGATAT